MEIGPRPWDTGLRVEVGQRERNGLGKAGKRKEREDGEVGENKHVGWACVVIRRLLRGGNGGKGVR